jgi:hypothetical protein
MECPDILISIHKCRIQRNYFLIKNVVYHNCTGAGAGKLEVDYSLMVEVHLMPDLTTKDTMYCTKFTMNLFFVPIVHPS